MLLAIERQWTHEASHVLYSFLINTTMISIQNSLQVLNDWFSLDFFGLIPCYDFSSCATEAWIQESHMHCNTNLHLKHISYFLFWDGVLLSYPGWPRTHSIAQEATRLVSLLP